MDGTVHRGAGRDLLQPLRSRALVAERDTLTGRVAAAAPALAAAVMASAHDDVWTRRLPALPTAWDRARRGV